MKGSSDYDMSEAMAFDEKLLIDTHCHLDFLFRRLEPGPRNFAEFRRDFREFFPNSYEGCIAVFCEPRSWFKYGLESSLELEPEVRVIYGCHPHFANEFDHYAKLTLENALKRPNVVGLGEIGLDYSGKNSCHRIVQQRAFRSQLQMGMKLKLPFCLHIRDADEDGMAILKEVGMPSGYPFHLHCFTGSWKTCQIWLDKFPGCKIGLTPLITVSSAYQVREVARQIPLNRLLLETDAPYFLPNKVKYESDYPLTNSHPGFAIHTAAQVASLKKVSLKEVLKATRNNVTEIYGFESLVAQSQTKKAEIEEPSYERSLFFDSSVSIRPIPLKSISSSEDEIPPVSKASLRTSKKSPEKSKMSKSRDSEKRSQSKSTTHETKKILKKQDNSAEVSPQRKHKIEVRKSVKSKKKKH